MKEKWKSHPVFTEYLISNNGRVAKIRNKRWGSSLLNKEPRTCTKYTRQGYMAISLMKPEGGHTHKFVHVLVAETFIGERPMGYCVNHKDGIKTNNYVSNLEYVTHSDNLKHAYSLGLRGRNTFYRGDCNASSKLTENQVRSIKKKLKKYKRGMCKELGKEYGILTSTISAIKRGENWGWLIV